MTLALIGVATVLLAPAIRPDLRGNYGTALIARRAMAPTSPVTILDRILRDDG